jgi:hypothetical protein
MQPRATCDDFSTRGDWEDVRLFLFPVTLSETPQTPLPPHCRPSMPCGSFIESCRSRAIPQKNLQILAWLILKPLCLLGSDKGTQSDRRRTDEPCFSHTRGPGYSRAVSLVLVHRRRADVSGRTADAEFFPDSQLERRA